VTKEQASGEKGRAIADFIEWAMTTGQEQAEDLDYARLPESVVKVNMANLMSLTTAGKPLVAKK
jgi:hypothetical protein